MYEGAVASPWRQRPPQPPSCEGIGRGAQCPRGVRLRPAAGPRTLLRFANGAATAIGRDAGERAPMTATDADGRALWSGGAYAYF